MEKFYERNFYVYENNESEARDFLEKVVKNFIKENFKINKVWNDYPFLNNEKQSFSALVPAIHKLTGVVCLEQPFKRVNKKAIEETGKDETQRFIDLATMYGINDAMYLFEVKHGWHNFSTNSFKQRFCDRWFNAIKQTSHLTFQNLSIYERKNIVFYRIAFMIVPSYLTFDKSKKHKNDKFPSARENAQRLFEELKFSKSQMPNFVMIYKLDTSRHLDEYAQIFPFLNFIIRGEKFGKNAKNG